MNTDVLTSQVWPNGTEVSLYSVPWDSSYRDVVAWESDAARDAWFAEHRGHTFPTKFHWLRPAQPIVVECPYSTAYQYNYLSVRNPANPVTDEGDVRTLYYFISDAQPQNTGTCTLTVQLDVMTTYGCSLEFGNTYVESGHYPMHQLDDTTFTAEELRRWCCAPEGLDCGTTYVPASKTYTPLLGSKPDIVVISTADLTEDPGTTAEPSLSCAQGQFAEDLVSGCAVYVFALDDFLNAMRLLSKKSWVSQCIISIYAFPGGLITGTQTATLFGKSGNPTMRVLNETAHLTVAPDAAFATVSDVFAELAKGIPERMRHLQKLYTYPYSVIEVSAFNGNPLYLKPEQLLGRELRLFLVTMALQPFAKIGVFPYPYNQSSEGDNQLTFSYANFREAGQTGRIGAGDFLDTCLWLTEFPSFSIVNNMYYSALARTANTRLYQYQSAGWGLESANAATRTAYNNAQAQQMQSYDAYGRSADAARLNFNDSQALSGANLAVSTVGRAVGGDYAGAAVGGALGAAQLAVSGNNFNRTMGASNANASSAYQVGRQVADANYELAAWQNQGNYANTIRGIQAAVQDMALTPPSTVGQMGGEGLTWKEGLFGVLVTFKVLAPGAINRVAEYFARYGYAYGGWVTLQNVSPSRAGIFKLAIMSHFTYWKTQDMQVLGSRCNESERAAIRGVFNRGVTLWNSPSEIGKVNLFDNRRA